MKKKPLKITWRGWCLYKLAKRDYSSFEMKQAIIKRANESEQTVDPEPIVQQLVEEGLIDDERYVQSQIRLHTEIFARKGPKAIRADLRKKGGISSDLIEKYVDSGDTLWFQTAERISRKALIEKGFDPDTSSEIPAKLYFKIKQKLYRNGFTEDQIRFALEGVSPIHEKPKAESAVDARKWVEKRMSTGKGPYDIRQYLRQKGVAKEEIPQYLAYPEEVWIEIAAREREKRFGAEKPKAAKDKRKQTEFLQRRGFSFDHIREILK
ncbi:MAG: regulatory protein RecX [Proteobacteria bacterium]|nr:regulatory protein RecX [Pseudomonadota bacterium]